MLFVEFKSQYICVSSVYLCFKIEDIFYCEDLVIKGYTGGIKNTESAVDISALRVNMIKF